MTDIENKDKVTRTEEEWRQMLSAEEFEVTRRAGTERPFTGVYWNEERDGKYMCKCCDSELFDSSTKFDAGCGWPSFYAPLESDSVINREDNTLGMRRIEVLCAKCDAHLGHVFPDGPVESGLRYCINSASLDFKEESKEGE